MGKRIFAIAMALALIVVMALPLGVSAETVVITGDVGATPTVTEVLPASGNFETAIPVDVTITGTGFVQGEVDASLVEVSGEGVTVSNMVVVGATSITATFTIASSAASGTRDVSVTIAGQKGTGSGLFTVNSYMTVTLTPIDFDVMAVGVASEEYITVTVGTNETGWTAEAKDANIEAGTKGHMLKTTTPLINELKIGKTTGPTTNADVGITYTNADTKSFPFYVSQTVTSGDAAGAYTITISFTGNY